ncbi:AtpZ/AtpI family protein [Allosalinactinospora lopnorensis]|uniref:AtpZ/AtpI family protein n=1 Tax=Allosalinactinospora lopnorensis TaxID=1352348 RepID=UPI000623DB62|nr:hypothetical protein [Allosalinactinospora lopnorensis]
MNVRHDGDHDHDSQADPMSLVAILLGGILAWGGLGWLADWALGFQGLFLPIGIVLGAAGAVYLIYVRYVRS